MSEIILPPGWLRADVERAARRFKEWADRPITKAQNARVRASRAERDECDHDWHVPDGWQSGYCRKCRRSSV